ncbi:hypothetical protein TRFO_34793 [Tritrichomonas foetus]|uniref:Uncharacterized protein n=1 Tax=Tritrichomonas foetus TaxID=1144522 RepID=A0A1J4JIC2_9EUKA|nr:hypothetical protein TRFO_34793 [Tritrichomonas foetus]|eukprot:OHS98886.1 hypothetical protein TRFO_34793 [Tritrichomonas foetus]
MKIQFKEEANIVIATVSYKRKVPAEQRTAIVEFINQINIEISIGGFEMDRRDGEIRFRHSIDVEGLNCTEIFAHNFVNSVAMTGCKYYNALCSVMDGKVQEAYSMI